MSTRSLTAVLPAGATEATDVDAYYVHFDGYPTARLVTLRDIAAGAGLDALVGAMAEHMEFRCLDADEEAGEFKVAGIGSFYPDAAGPDTITYNPGPEPTVTGPGVEGAWIEWVYLVDLAAGVVEVFDNHAGDDAARLRGRVVLAEVTDEVAQAVQKGTFKGAGASTPATTPVKVRVTWAERNGFGYSRKERSRTTTVPVLTLSDKDAPVIASVTSGPVRTTPDGRLLVPLEGSCRRPVPARDGKGTWRAHLNEPRSVRDADSATLAARTTYEPLVMVEGAFYQMTSALPDVEAVHSAGSVYARLVDASSKRPEEAARFAFDQAPAALAALTQAATQAGVEVVDRAGARVVDADAVDRWVRRDADATAARQASVPLEDLVHTAALVWVREDLLRMENNPLLNRLDAAGLEGLAQVAERYAALLRQTAAQRATLPA